MKTQKIIFSIVLLVFVLSFPVMNAHAQILNQDLEKDYEKTKKELNANNTPNQNPPAEQVPPPPQTAAQAKEEETEFDGDGTEIGGAPPRENFSTLSQQDADTIIEAAKSLETENPELAKKLLDIGK